MGKKSKQRKDKGEIIKSNDVRKAKIIYPPYPPYPIFIENATQYSVWCSYCSCVVLALF